MEILGCDKNSTYYIGDSEVDLETAKNSGLKSISVTWGYKDREFLLSHGAENIVEKPREILEILH